MKVCACPVCGTVHEAAPSTVLNGLTEEQVYARTHCKLCESPSSRFVALADEPDLKNEEFGYPLAVVRWLKD